MLANVIALIIMTIIVIVLIRKKKFKTSIKWGYFYKHVGKSLSISYKKFTGVEYYQFVLSKEETVTISYEVTVEEGELVLEWSDGKQIVWKEKFEEDKRGTLTILTAHRIHLIKVEGEKTKGGCRIQFI